VDVSAASGYGDWGPDGAGRYESWRAFLAAVIDDHDEGYYAHWHRLFSDSFLERDLYETAHRRMLHLAERCPQERRLVHNDYQFENILAEGARITGVIDWANALYGDPLYDVAWLLWQAAHPDWWHAEGPGVLHERFGAAPGYAARIACYALHIGLDHLRFYARTDNRARYDEARIFVLDHLRDTEQMA
jgi:hygromycin-B 4-O-kinase